jgi:uncharacterized protein YndB with AHSA1/START domain
MSTDRIEKTILLRASREKVWRALADPADFGRWFGVSIDGPFETGAAVVATMAGTHKKYEGMTFEMWIDRIEPTTLFSFRWHPHAIDQTVDYSAEDTTLVEFHLEDAPEGVLLTLVESGFDKIPLARRAQAFSSNDGGWTQMLGILRDYLAQTE